MQKGRPSRYFENVRVDTAGATDVGEVRKKNEDQYLIAGLRRVVEIEATSIPIEGRPEFTRGASALLLLVADGVGGSKGGEEASSRTLDCATGDQPSVSLSVEARLRSPA